MDFGATKLPPDWRLAAIADAYRFTSKPRGLRWEEGEVPFLPMEQIPIGKAFVSAYSLRPAAEIRSGTYVENGDLVVAKITPSFENGKQAIICWDRERGFATTEVIPIQDIEGLSDKRYLSCLLLHPEIRASLAARMEGTTGRQRLSKDVLGRFQIPLPPLPEQRKIATVLGLVQRNIEQQDRLVALADESKHALVHKLMSEGLRSEPLVDSDIGLIPKSWTATRLGDLIAEPLRNGHSARASNSNVGVRTLTLTAVTQRDFSEKH